MGWGGDRMEGREVRGMKAEDGELVPRDE
jgi:hypothetical protein